MNPIFVCSVSISEMSYFVLRLALFCISIRFSQSVILSGACPTPPDSSIYIGPEQVYHLKALVPLREDQPRDNFFSDIWEIQTATCERLVIFRDTHSGNYNWNLSKHNQKICNRVEGVLRPQQNQFNLEYRIGTSRPKRKITSCLREDSLSKEVSVWLWNETIIMWTCNDYKDNNTHDEALMVFRLHLSPFNISEMVKDTLSFSELEENYLIVKEGPLCESPKKCPEFQCSHNVSGLSKLCIFAAGSILLVVLIIIVRFIWNKLKHFIE